MTQANPVMVSRSAFQPADPLRPGIVKRPPALPPGDFLLSQKTAVQREAKIIQLISLSDHRQSAAPVAKTPRLHIQLLLQYTTFFSPKMVVFVGEYPGFPVADKFQANTA